MEIQEYTGERRDEGMSNKPIAQQFKSAVLHAYSVGDKVRVTGPHMMCGAEGEICAQMPYTFVAPAYYVKVNGMVFAVSERSLEVLKRGRR